ncbi:hypothetical protein PFISCL1PPCAC_26503, partial [Pristionchus fissidentatus]
EVSVFSSDDLSESCLGSSSDGSVDFSISSVAFTGSSASSSMSAPTRSNSGSLSSPWMDSCISASVIPPSSSISTAGVEVSC